MFSKFWFILNCQVYAMGIFSIKLAIVKLCKFEPRPRKSLKNYLYYRLVVLVDLLEKSQLNSVNSWEVRIIDGALILVSLYCLVNQ